MQDLWLQERNRLLALANEEGIVPAYPTEGLQGVREIAEALMICPSEHAARSLLREDRVGTRAFLLVISSIEGYEPEPGQPLDETELTPFGNLIKAVWGFLPD